MKKKINRKYDSSKFKPDMRNIRVKDRRTGKDKRILTNAQKGYKYANELRTGYRETNDGDMKFDRNTGMAIELTDTQKAYRSGYLEARRDIGKAFSAVKNK